MNAKNVSLQQYIGAWTRGAGCLLLASLVIVCLIDVRGFADRGHLMMPFSSYMAVIFSGVAMQFVGAAVTNMRFDDQ